MFTRVYSCLPVYHCYSCMFTYVTHVSSCVPRFTCAYLFLTLYLYMFNYVYRCLFMFTRVCLFTTVTCACLTMFTHVYLSLPMFTYGSPEGHSDVRVQARYDIGSGNGYGTTPGLKYRQPRRCTNHTAVGGREYISFQGNRKNGGNSRWWRVRLFV